MARFLSSSDLAARMERAEAALIAGVAVHAGAGSPFNKVAGPGFGGAPGESELERLERAFDERRAPLRVELCSHADPAVAAALAGRGYGLAGFEDVPALELPAQGLPALPSAITVRRALAAEDAPWLSLLVRGFAQPGTRGVAADERFTADLDGQPAGAAGLRLAEGSPRCAARPRCANGAAAACRRRS